MSKHEELRAVVSAPPATTAATGIVITNVSGTSVGVNYTGLNGNNPGSNANFIVIFQSSSDVFPFGTTNKPIATQPINGSSTGSVIIPASILINTSYVVGYSVGAAAVAPLQPYANVCATAFIPTTGTNYPSTGSSITLQDVEANSISCNYNLPNGILPQTNGAWAGLWVGNNPSYSVPPSFYTQINSNSAQGGPLIFNNVLINRGTLFSIALFTSGWLAGGVGSVQTAMACTLQFTS